MTLSEITPEQREEIRRLAARHGARNVRIFGSAAREEALHWYIGDRVLAEAQPL